MLHLIQFFVYLSIYHTRKRLNSCAWCCYISLEASMGKYHNTINILLFNKKNIKKNFNKNGRKCRDVKTQKVCKQSQDGTNTQEEPKLNNHLQKTQQKYLQCYKAKDKQLYFCIGLYGSGLFNSLVLC